MTFYCYYTSGTIKQKAKSKKDVSSVCFSSALRVKLSHSSETSKKEIIEEKRKRREEKKKEKEIKEEEEEEEKDEVKVEEEEEKEERGVNFFGYLTSSDNLKLNRPISSP